MTFSTNKPKNHIIELYTQLATNPTQDFGWNKGKENAIAHGYKQVWIDKLPNGLFDYCAAVGNPFSLGDINKSDTILDLGCGAGVDLLIASLMTGDDGKVIGVDITPKMIEKAKYHSTIAQASNIELHQCSFESIPIEDESVDIVISNGAINLSKSKEKVFKEIYRILKPNGRLQFADMIDISTPKEPTFCSIDSNHTSCCEPSTQEDDLCCSDGTNDWANCVDGTLTKDVLIDMIRRSGFTDVQMIQLTDYKTSENTSGATFRAIKEEKTVIRNKHWENVFKTKDYTKVLWHEEYPEASLKLLKNIKIQTNSAIIDVGAGASLLVDALLKNSIKDISLLDISSSSLHATKKRLGVNSGIPKYIVTDVTLFNPSQKYDIWHDRAAFHFLLTNNDKKRYFEVLSKALKHNAMAIIGTFALDGPKTCSDLDVFQYDESRMLQVLSSDFKLIKTHHHTHITPFKTEQKYIYFIIQKVR